VDTLDVTVVIATRDRRAVLCEALARLEGQSGEVGFEVVVVDDGSADGTADAVREVAARGALDLRLIEQPSLGPAAARNRAIAEASAPVCLFLNDDSWARPDLLARHHAFHRREPDSRAALLGAIVVASEPRPTPFMRWLGEALFDYRVDGRADVGGARFFTANVSAKTGLLRSSRGFYEGFATAAYEDLDLGLRLEREHGMRLAHDAHAVVEHAHPMDLESALARLWRQGREMATFVDRNPDWDVPRRPGIRHRAKAFLLGVPATMGIRSQRLQREIWRFLCHEASREGYWSAVDSESPERDDPEGDSLRIGRRLAHRAIRDEDARLPRAADGRAWTTAKGRATAP
jgi:glycosyltransferase involved in cell wall biosynthesis